MTRYFSAEGNLLEETGPHSTQRAARRRLSHTPRSPALRAPYTDAERSHLWRGWEPGMSPGAKCFVDSEKARRFSLCISGTGLKSHLEPRVGLGEASLRGSDLEEHGQVECRLQQGWEAVWSCRGESQ